MRIVNSDEFSLLDPLQTPVDHRHLLSGSFDDQGNIFASLNILGRIALVNTQLIGVLNQLGRISTSLVSYEKTLARRQRSQHFKRLAEESSAFRAATESQSLDSPLLPPSRFEP